MTRTATTAPCLTLSQRCALRVLIDAWNHDPLDYMVHGPTSDAHVGSLRALCRRGLARRSYGPYFGLRSVDAARAALARPLALR